MSSRTKVIVGVVGFLFVVSLFSGDDSESVLQATNNTEQQAVVSVNGTKSEETNEMQEELPSIAEVKLYSVDSVVDGDTVKLSIDGKAESVRLIGIDTPETVHPSKPVECFGREASNKAKELLEGQRVSIETDSTQGERDKYDRLLAYIILEDGTNFNEFMISEGYGYEYTYDLAYKYQDEFKKAQQEAEENKRGLWADDVCEEEEEEIVNSLPESTHEVTPPPVQAVQNSAPSYTCSYNAYNCSDFSTHSEAQSVYLSCGGVDNDVHRLDGDSDGSACETLP